MEQRVSLITLGVEDLARARTLLRGARDGRRARRPPTTSCSSRRASMIVALWGREQLTEDSAVHDSGGYGGVTLAYNARGRRGSGRGDRGGARRRRDGSAASPPRPSGAGTRACSSIPTATRGRWRTTRTGPWGRTGRSRSGPERLGPRERMLTGGPSTTSSRPEAARSLKKNRQRPTLPGPCEPSTIGAEGLNCSVRNGKRCFPLAKATGKR